jgi:hypothetical protein
MDSFTVQSAKDESESEREERAQLVAYLFHYNHGIPNSGSDLSTADQEALLQGGELDELGEDLSRLRSLPLASLRSAQESVRAELERDARSYLAPLTDQDIDRYSRYPFWTLNEAAALTAGVRPHSNSLAWCMANQAFNARAAEVIDVFEVYQRARQIGVLGERNTPRQVLRYARRAGFAAPQRFDVMPSKSDETLDAQDEVKINSELNEESDEDFDLSLAERLRAETPPYDIVMNMLGALYLSKYKFDPEAIRNTSVATIASVLENYDIKRTPKMILAYIRLAILSLPEKHHGRIP